MICPLCHGKESNLFDQDKLRSYFQCSDCLLVFVPRNQLISEKEEFERYESHENHPEDAGYSIYLSNIASEIIPHIPSGSSGLDFGCGKSKLLEKILRERGYSVDSYDLYFHPQSELLNKKYDFIILSEVIEHLRDLESIMKIITTLLKPHGNLFVKTKLLPEKSADFANWFYKRDKTHVQFFSETSFAALKRIFKLSGGEAIGKDLFRFIND